MTVTCQEMASKVQNPVFKLDLSAMNWLKSRYWLSKTFFGEKWPVTLHLLHCFNHDEVTVLL